MKFSGKLVVVLGVILGSAELIAGPTIIRDNRVTDLSTTPVLGRGYSIGTNTFQSTCMEKVVITEPSYDMKYSFVQLEDKGEEKSSTSDQNSQEQTSSERKSGSKTKTEMSGFLTIFGGGGGISGNYSSTRSGIDESIKSLSKSTTIQGKTYYNHSMLVTVNLFSYYASVDEGRSKLSTAARSLLRSQDLPGFFSSCGPYYVRSIGRHSTFVSIFSYQSESESRDQVFESQLKTEITRFSTESKSSFKASAGGVNTGSLWGGGGGASLSTDKSTETLSSSDIEEQQRRQEFNRTSETYRLTIDTSAYGLGKDKKATLISFDMDTYKSAVKDAFMSMQNPETGKVSSIEVVPWVENTEFQALVPLEAEVAGSGTDKKETEQQPKKLLYEKKHILNQNAEFFMEIERVDRNKMNMYYKARLCKKNIDINFKDGDAIKEEYTDVQLVNHRGGNSLTLAAFTEKLTDDYVQDLLKKELVFMYGSEDGQGDTGAAECIRQIMTRGIYLTSYRQIAECQPIYEQMGEVQIDLLENFCMPEVVKY